jgi:holo-[acyl-carrier protein] synthase
VIVGIGTDIVDVARFGQALDRTPALRQRLFTEREQTLPLRSLAARFAAKEALAKAMGSPGGLVWRDAEVLRAEGGQPSLAVTGSVAAAAAGRGISTWHVSLSHDGGLATAMVVAER